MKKAKDAKGKKAAKVKDLPARSLKGKDAAAVKGGLFNPTGGLVAGKIEGKFISSLPDQDQFLKLGQ